MSVTHLAGDAVIIGGRGIQRCLICGEKLIDTKGRMMLIDSDPSEPWQAGGYVRHDGNMWIALPGAFPDGLPKDICIDLVEA